MPNLVAMLKDRQGKGSPELFANSMGIRYSSLHAYYTGRKELGASNAKKMAQAFARSEDWTMVYAIASFILGIELPPKNDKPKSA